MKNFGVLLIAFAAILLLPPPAFAQISVQERQTEEGLLLRQETPGYLYMGTTATARFVAENNSRITYSNLTMTIWHAFEDARPVAIPEGCLQTLAGDGARTLSCRIGNMSPGQKFEIEVTIASDEVDVPVLRIGGSLNVPDLSILHEILHIHDTLTDTDGDGVTDFIERMARTDALDSDSVDHSDWIVDLLLLYTASAKEQYQERGGIKNRIMEYVDFGNDVLRDSGARVQLRVAHLEELEYEEDGSVRPNILLDRVRGLEAHDAFANVQNQRAETGADLIVLFGVTVADDICGLAGVPGPHRQGDIPSLYRETGYAFVAVSCNNVTFIHEIGHNFGNGHSHVEMSLGTFAFSLGHGVQESFSTIMAGEGDYNAPGKIHLFSNPDLDCNGHPCGVPIGEDLQADAVTTINITAPQISQWFHRPWPEGLRVSETHTADDSPTGSTMSLGILNEAGEYASAVFAGDTMDMLVEIRPDEADIGQEATMHVLVVYEGDTGTTLQLDRNGEVSVWDGNVGSLAPFQHVGELFAVERFYVLKDITLPLDLAGTNWRFSIAYRVGDKAVFISRPQTLLIVQKPN